MRLLTIIIVALGSLLLASCFDIREEIWIERDGSGRIEMNYSVPTSALAMVGGDHGIRDEVQRIFDSEPALRLDEFLATSSGGNTNIRIKASTDSMLSLLDIRENEALQSLPESASGFMGDFDVGLDGLAINFDRRIDLQKAVGVASLVISGDQRKQREITYVIHLPTEPGTHNATRTADDGKTLIWTYSLGEALSSPISTSFVVNLPIPWWVIIGSTVLLVFLVWMTSKAWRRRKARLQKS